MRHPHATRVNPGGDRRTITATFEWPDGKVRSFVAPSQADLAADALARHGRPLRLLALSNPTSIYADLIGQPHPPPLDPELAAILLETPEPFASKRRAKERRRLKAAKRRLFG